MQKANIKFKGLLNTRDLCHLSQYSCLNIKPKMLYRSARIDKLSHKQRAKFLKDNNIGIVIDLRNEVEIKQGHKLTFEDSVTFYNIPILGKEFFGITHEKHVSTGLKREAKRYSLEYLDHQFIVDMYKRCLFDETAQKNIRKFFDILLDNKDHKGILFNCQSGKDRTGLIAMLLLHIFKVDDSAIVEDYSMTGQYLESYVKRTIFLINLGFCLGGISRHFRRLLFSMLDTRKEYMLDTIKAVNEKYGSLDNYIKDALHVDEEQQEKLRQIYCTKKK
ncbi:MAG: tyrosine-protein phosphatase [Bacilli bacterium]|nr:tyrosine-protein phosphatase [Bacilli bacterium]